MDSKINKGRIEFNDENYETALRYFDEVSEDDEDYMYVLIFKITCLMELERYDKALFIIESILREDPEDELLLYEKIRCHIALGENKEALNTLKDFENVISADDKQMLLAVSKFYNKLDRFDDALRFCEMALEVDGYFEEAVREKSFIAVEMDDVEMIDWCAERLLKICSCDDTGLVSVFLLKLYIGKFDDCLGVVNSLEGNFKDDTILMLKSIVYKVFSDQLGVNIHLYGDVDVPLEKAIALLKDYAENGINCGNVCGVEFRIR